MENQKTRGRPRTEHYTTFTMTLPVTMEQEITEIRFREKFPSHTQAVREILAAGLKVFSQGAEVRGVFLTNINRVQQ